MTSPAAPQATKCVAVDKTHNGLHKRSRHFQQIVARKKITINYFLRLTVTIFDRWASKN